MADFGAFGLIPPIVAIVAAMATRKVFQSLLMGIFVAGIMVAGAQYLGYTPAIGADGAYTLGDNGPNQGPVWLLPFAAIAGGFFQMVRWIVDGIAGIDSLSGEFYIGHPAVIAFTVFLGALVALMQRAGGVQGFGEFFMGLGTGRRGAMLFSSIGGIFLAIDDYFHVIAAGSVFRPVTDRLHISREKLSYLIDSTAAPAVILVPISTWAGYIIGQISSTTQDLGVERGAFGIFLDGVPFNFYAILTILFVVFIAATGSDFGPMRRAERRAMLESKLLRDGAKPLMASELDRIQPSLAPRARNLLLPVLFLIVMTVIVLAVQGGFPGKGLGSAIQDNPEPEMSLAISSFLTILFAMMLFAFQGMSQDDFVDRSLDGAKALVPAIVILALAWGIGNAVQGVGLGDWIAGSVGDRLAPEVVPLVAFILAGLIAFATGTSFGTFAIMIPITLPVAFATGGAEWLGPALAASVGGAVFGDHCSPISDTTVMSSMAAQADHIDHVRTQIPYALTVAGIATIGYGALALSGLFGSEASPGAGAAFAWIVNLVVLAVVALLTWTFGRPAKVTA